MFFQGKRFVRYFVRVTRGGAGVGGGSGKNCEKTIGT